MIKKEQFQAVRVSSFSGDLINRRTGDIDTSNLSNKTEELCREIDNLLKITGKGTITPSALARFLKLKTSGKASALQNSELVCRTARNLHMASGYAFKPILSLEEAKKIAIQLMPMQITSEKVHHPKKIVVEKTIDKKVKDKSGSIVFEGEEITFSEISKNNLKLLEILSKTFVNNQISYSKLAISMFGNELKIKIAKNRLGAMLPNLKGEVIKYNLAIKVKKTIGVRAGEERTFYYLSRKKNLSEEKNLSKSPIKSKICAKQDILERYSDCNIVFEGKEINIFGISVAKKKMLEILAETSENNPIPRALLAEKVYGADIDIVDAKDRTAALFPSAKKTLEKHGLTVATKREEVWKRKGNKVFYYLKKVEILDKQNAEEVVKTKIPAKADIFVPEKNKAKEDSDSEFLIPRGFSESKLPEPAEKLDQKFLLTSDEICIVAISIVKMSLLKRETSLGINANPISAPGIQAIINRTAIRLEKKGQKRVDLEKENILSIIDKFEKYKKNPSIYLESCDEKRRALFDCFNGTKINRELWEKLFPDQIELIRDTKVKKEVLN